METPASKVCALPWKHLATHPHGMVSLCCRAIFKDDLGMARTKRKDGWVHFHNLNTDSIEDTMNSDSFCETRKQMLAGEEPAACADCFASEKRGVESKRQQENRQYNFSIEEARKLTREDGKISPSFKFIELRLGNLCNLKCRTCNPASSSKWVADYQHLEKHLDFLRPYKNIDDFSWVESETFWKDLESKSGELEMIYINGGEPTLIQSHWNFLRGLITRGLASKIALNYNSNMTHFKPEFFEIWKQFKKVQVGASIDDVGARNHYIRHPSNWIQIEKNLQSFRDQGVDIYITQTVSAYNLFYLNELSLWAQERNIAIGYNFVIDPSFLSVQALPLSVRRQALEKLKQTLPFFQYSQVESLVDQSHEATELRQFIKFNHQLDILRKEKFSEVFPELSQILQSVVGNEFGNSPGEANFFEGQIVT